ncbi:alkaline phosphatase [Sphingobacterium puteale]|uniref:Alkaline phosphatase n=1 Tax=Sphingobacterium puteale TaxID=2420510 RepID=A0A420VVA7_9SPHI|nr:alkaline phosphatase [Sphingobacterium puteale]RKO70318.1 alkaline phosphatase [Sphingobacterium puteale]
MVKSNKLIWLLFASLSIQSVSAQQKLTANAGHSHNDYKQQIPLLAAYYAGMGSIEADVFYRNGELYVAHESSEIKPGKTLKKLYIEPLIAFFKENGNRPYADPSQKLQLVIDIKENYEQVLSNLLENLKGYEAVFDQQKNPSAIKIVISGNIPPVEKFNHYPQFIYFDGRPEKDYSPEQLKRIGMISQSIAHYSVWNGKGTPTPPDLEKMKTVIDKAHKMGKPFRFWATKDSPNSWKELAHMGVDWINTDQPTALKNFYLNNAKVEYSNPQSYSPYIPNYKSDGATTNIKNVILLIGDGMGLAQIQAGLSANFGQSNIINMQHIGFSRTEASNSDFTDSAAGGTAIATGHKTNNRYIGVDENGKLIASIPDTLASHGIKSGIISSGDITDATPAAFYAHQMDRTMSQEIAADFLHSHVDILVGSHQESFLKNKNGKLMQKLNEKGYQLQTTLSDFEKATSGKQLVLLADSATRKVLDGRGDMLKTSLLKTIQLLSKNKHGFFIMAEGAQIDYGGHANDLSYVVTEQHDFDRLVGEALKFADQDGETLVIVTADHETGGLSLLDANYRKGSVRGNFSSDDHTNIMVPVFAYGPGSQHFIGVYNNTEIFKKILKAYRLN